jgi:RNA polymerase sigma factor (sigma-70 family)
MANAPEPFRAEELLEHLPSLRGLARALVHGDEVEDLVADTMLRAYERPPRHGRNIRAWLTATLRNLAIDRSRRSRAQSTREDRVRIAAQGKSDGAKPDEILARSEALHLLHSMLRELDDADHQLLLLRYFEGLNATQIGARLDLPPATVRTRLTRALGRLRALMRERYGNDAFAPCLLILNPLSIHGLTTASGLVSIITMAKSSNVFLAAAAVLLALPLYSVLVHDDDPQGTEDPLAMAPPVEVDAPFAPTSGIDRVENRELESVATTGPVQAPEYRTPKIQITVLDALTRAPVADADVFIFDPGSPSFDSEAYQREVRISRMRVDAEAEARKYGDLYRTNAVGVVELDGLYSNQLLASAVTETSYARVSDFPLPSNVETYKCELLLRLRVNLAVQVRFPDGQPAREVGVEYLAGKGGGKRGSYLRAFTNEVGLAKLRNLQAITSAQSADVTEHSVRVSIASNDPVTHEFSLDAIPRSPIQIVIPQTVALRVKVPDEFPAKGRWYMHLVAEGSVARPECFVEQGATGDVVTTADLVEGEARFEYVQPGFRGYVRLQLPTGGGQSFLWQRVEVPMNATGEVSMQMKFPEDRIGFPVLIVDKEGELLDDQTWSISGHLVEDGTASTLDARLPAGQSESWKIFGRVSVQADATWSGSCLLNVQHKDEQGVVQVAFLDLQGSKLDAHEPRIQVVAYDDLIASGRIVDGNGNPMERVRLGFNGKYRDTGAGFYDAFDAIIWTGPDGRFELRGELGILTELEAMVPGSSSDSFRFVEGKEDQVFVIELGADLKGTVLVDEGISADLVGASLLGADGKQLRGLIEIKAGGKVRVQYQTAGPAELVLSDTFGKELFRSPYFELVGGEIVEPDFLNPADLRGRLHQHRVEVLAPDGSQVSEFVLREVESGRTAKGRSPLTLVSVDSHFQAVVDAPGYALSEPVTVAGDEVVQLAAPIQLKLDVPEGLNLENSKFDWVLRCESTDGSVPDWQLVREIYLDGGGQVLQLPHAGRWQLSLSAQRKHSTVRGSIQGMRNRTTVPLGDAAAHELEIRCFSHPTLLPRA